jgi:hypothetical protein
MAFSNYRTTALMLFYVAFAASGVEAEVIRQHLTVGKNENAMAPPRQKGPTKTGAFGVSWVGGEAACELCSSARQQRFGQPI